MSDRFTRLNDPNTQMVLYHQTKKEYWEKIRLFGTMTPGDASSICGSAIYFAESPGATGHEAHQKGVILQCTVKRGNQKLVPSQGEKHTFQSLSSQGYDSVLVPRKGGTEHVVYSSDQVSIDSYSYDGGKNWKEYKRKRCRAPGCTKCGPGHTHYCSVCKVQDVDHRSSNCPNRRAQLSVDELMLAAALFGLRIS